MTIVKLILTSLFICFFAANSFAKETSFNCKPQSAAAVRSNGIHVFKITGKEEPIQIIIKDGENQKSGYFIFNTSKYEILNLGGRAYAFNKNEPWTHIQDIFFLDDESLSFILSANASIARYICNEKI